MGFYLFYCITVKHIKMYYLSQFIYYTQVTADANMGCTNSFGASSAAAAMASGLIALMLSAKWVVL